MYNISYNKIVYFLTTAELLSLSEASKVLYMTQPALGRQITALEEELNMQLFIRTPRGLKLTPAGAYLKEEWKYLKSQIDSSVRQARKISEGYSGELYFGVLEEINFSLIMRDLIAVFETLYPGIRLHLYRFGFRDLREKLLAGELDMILTYRFDLEDVPDIACRNVYELHPAWAVPRRNPLFQRESVSFQDFQDEEFIITSEEDIKIGRQKVIQDCQKYGGFYPAFYEVDSVSETVLHLETGDRCAILNMELNIAQSPDVKMFPLPPDKPEYYSVAWSVNTENPCVEILAKLIDERI